jgi:hypothetical protein
MQVKDISKQAAADELPIINRMHTTWHSMLRLVVNALAYMSAYPDDIQKKWPSNVPHDLYLQMQNGKPKQSLRAASKLAALGFTPVHLCGQKIAAERTKSSFTGSNVEKFSTWVRGHWIRQAHGPNLSLRRLQWRMPHLRNADAPIRGGEHGHIYLVD